MKIRITTALMMVIALTAYGGDVSTDNLTVMEKGTFYGAVEIKTLTGSNPTNGMKLFYNFATNTTPVPDESGNSNTGTVTSATWISGGRINGAYNFDGSDDKIVSATYMMANLNYTSCFSMVMWIYKDSTCSTDRMPLLINGPSSGNFGAGFYVNNGGYGIRFGAMKQNVAWVMIGSNNLTNNLWQMVVGTYSNRDMKLYIDGVNVASGTFPYTDTTAASQPLVIGCQNSGAWFKGKMDEIRIYNCALSADEVLGLYGYYSTNGPASLTVENISSSNSINQTSASTTNTFMGMVGIGTNSPATNVMLHVNGDTRVEGSLTATTAPASSNEVGNLGFNDSRYAQLGATNAFTQGASFDEGITKVKQLGDVGMGSYTNGP